MAHLSVREKYENYTWFTDQFRRHVLYELPIRAGGEKPERQQHIRDERAQNQKSHTRGVTKTENVTRTEGAKKKKK